MPFRISDLVNKVEPFKLEYDGCVLEGEWWKYKTTTPNYAKEFLDSLPEIPENGTEEEKEEARSKRNEALSQHGAMVLTDTIKSWNAVGENDEPLPISIETFNQLPEPFITCFGNFLKELREGAQVEKKSLDSPNG